jgi:uncharacterized protein GlcG (DUF336 family)
MGAPLPGDHAPMIGGGGGGGGAGAGGPGAGGGAPRPAAGPPAPRPPDPVSPGPPIELALKAAQAVAAACKQYPYAMAVVDTDGVAKIVWTPDNAAGWHAYSAIRKAYTAVTFKQDTSQVIKQIATDPAIAAKFKADPNLQRQAGGLVLMSGGKVIGAIGVSGAEPGGHDEECGSAGRDKIKADLK